MDDIEIKKRLKGIIEDAPFGNVMEFLDMFCHEHKPENIDSDFIDWLVDWVFNAPASIKGEFLPLLDKYMDHPLRICSVCGNFMYEGYITADMDRYCSDECRLEDYKKLTDGDEAEALRLIEEDFCEDSYDFYYTEW